MRKIVVYEMLSLDGVAQDPDRFLGWDDVLDANLDDVIATQDAVVLGRRTHDEWAPFWPTSDLEPFAGFINRVPKHIATSTPLDGTWENAAVIEGDLVEFARSLRDGDGGDIGVHASISVARALLAAGVVDELRVVISPAVAGSGTRLLTDLPSSRLEVISSRTSPTGHLVVRYRVLAPLG